MHCHVDEPSHIIAFSKGAGGRKTHQIKPAFSVLFVVAFGVLITIIIVTVGICI